ncbi:MAG TPA: SPFH domain-containing protein [Polyangia bacterium]|nr:SPFH domain-containing protein [Polyangia bacterium]
MGLFGFVKGELVEVIDWLEADGDVLLHRFAGQSKSIKYGAQLTVRESQLALFVNEGRLADVYGPGRYPLTTETMPVMSRLHGWMHGFKSPFLSDVFFVSTRQFGALKWGTPNPVIMRDPELKQVRVRAFGTYSVRVADAPRFLRELAGTHAEIKLADVEGRLRHGIVSRFSDALAELGVSVLDLARNTTELGARLEPLLQPDFASLGLELVQFFIENASVPPEVEAMLDRVSQMNAVGDIARFAQFEAAASIRALAEKSGSGGVAGLGAEVAIGAAIGQRMAGALQPPAPAATAASPTPLLTAPGPAAAGRPPSPAGAPADREQILATLKELGALRDAGVLTPEEFQAKKAELLARL